MADTPLLDSPWLDILPPPAPADTTMPLTLFVLCLLALLAIILYKLWQQRPRQQALRQLTKLQRQLDRGQLDHRQCLYEINRLLRLGLRVPRLSLLKQKQAHVFYQRLSELQYRAAIPPADDTRQLLREALHIVRQQAA